jgi:hypothetical protein
MTKDLTNSNVERQNILNNRYAIEKVQEFIGLPGMLFEDEYRFTRKMVADFFDVDQRTLSRYLATHEKELRHNGYEVLKGAKLKDFKTAFGHLVTETDTEEQKDTNVPLETQTVDYQIGKGSKSLGIFNFRSFLNLSMLLVESEKARHLRSAILDIVIDTINERVGGSTKYINQRDEDYLLNAIREHKYRKEFTDALKNYLEMGNYKYSLYTDMIYNCIFKENSVEYRKILRLKERENIRDTMYAEVLKLIASFEIGISYELKKRSEQLGRKLMPTEVNALFKMFTDHPLQIPHIEDARIKMATRDKHFRDALHTKLTEYVQSVSMADFERFLGEKSKDFEKRLLEEKEVFNRLKNR